MVFEKENDPSILRATSPGNFTVKSPMTFLKLYKV